MTASEPASSFGAAMTEAHSTEVEKVLLYIADARDMARRAREQLVKDDAPEHALRAMQDAEEDLDALHRRVRQGTFYAIDSDTLKLAV